ncbi:hypothetical protein LMHOCYYV_CDS0072 [Staphylococcus phage PG-2021_4]
MGINFNRQHGGTTKIPVGDNILLELLYADLRKVYGYDDCPVEYDTLCCYGVFTVSIVTQDSKIKKKWKKQTLKLKDGDHVGRGDFRDLVKVKNKIKEIVDQLETHECFEIHGWDERRFRIYKHFLHKDEFILNRMFETSDTLYLMSKEGYKKTSKKMFTFNEKNDRILNRKEIKKNIKDWRMMSKC